MAWGTFLWAPLIPFPGGPEGPNIENTLFISLELLFSNFSCISGFEAL